MNFINGDRVELFVLELSCPDEGDYLSSSSKQTSFSFLLHYTLQPNDVVRLCVALPLRRTSLEQSRRVDHALSYGPIPNH